MNEEEKIAFQYLLHQGYKNVVHEPDGNVTPDFLIDGQIAIEVRRLNQNEDTVSGHKPKGLDDIAHKLSDWMEKQLSSLGEATAGESWYLFYRFKRPLPSWKQLKPRLRKKLLAFCDSSAACTETEYHISIFFEGCPDFNIRLMRAGKSYPEFFVIGGYVDRDAGGWVLEEEERNINICVKCKTEIVSKVLNKYPEWWLLLVDHVAYALSDDSRKQFHQCVKIAEHPFKKIILINPLNPKRAFEV